MNRRLANQAFENPYSVKESFGTVWSVSTKFSDRIRTLGTRIQGNWRV